MIQRPIKKSEDELDWFSLSFLVFVETYILLNFESLDYFIVIICVGYTSHLNFILCDFIYV